MKKVSIKKKADGARNHILSLVSDAYTDLQNLEDVWINLDCSMDSNAEIGAIRKIKEDLAVLELTLTGSFEKFTNEDICEAIEGVPL